MLAANPATVTEKYFISSGRAALHRTPSSHLNAQTRILACNSIHINRSCRNRISLAAANGFRIYGSEPLSLRSFRVSSGGGGSGGGGGGGSGSGGGDGGSSGGGGTQDSNWSFISCYARCWAMKKWELKLGGVAYHWIAFIIGGYSLSEYLSLLAEHPVITKAVTSAILTLVGDVICQLFIDKVPSPDLKRTFIFTLLGLVLVGPTLHFWYLYLSKLVTVPGASGTFLRLFLDQFVFSPIFIGTFLSTLVTLDGRPSNVIPKLKQEWFSSVVANWQLWIPFQFLNFQFVPQQFQVLAANFIALIWNVILSYKAHKEVPAE